MSAPIVINFEGEILLGLAALITALSTIVVPWLSLRASQKNATALTDMKTKVDAVAVVTTAGIQEVKEKVDAVAVVADQTHITTNSLSVRSEASAHEAGYAKGLVDGAAKAKAEAGADALAREKGLPPTGA